MKNRVWSILVFAVVLLFVTTVVWVPSNVDASVNGAFPTSTPEKPLSEDELSGLLDQLKEGLAELVGDEEKATAIAEKWDAREDLAGKTRRQVLELLFNDLGSVVVDKAVQNRVWAAWNAAPVPAADETSTQKTSGNGLAEYIESLDYDASSLLSVQSTGNQPMFEKVLRSEDQRIPGDGRITKCTRSSKSVSRNFNEIMILQPTRGAVYPGSVIIADRGLKYGGPRAISLPRAPVNLRVDLPGAANAGVVSVEQPNEANVRNAVNAALGGWNGSGSYREGQVDASRSKSTVSVAYSREQLGLGLGFDADWTQGPLSAFLNLNSNSETTVATLMVKKVFYTVSVDAPESPAGFFADGVTGEQAQAAFSSTAPPAYVSSVSYGRVMMFRIKTGERISASEAESALKYAAGLANVSASQKTAYDNILASSEINAATLGVGGQVTTNAVSAADIARSINGPSMTYSKANAGVPISFTVNFLKDNAAATVGATTQYGAEDCRTYPNYWLKLVQNGAYSAVFTVTWDEPGRQGSEHKGDLLAGFQMVVQIPGDATNVRMHLRTVTDWLIVNKVMQPNELNKTYETIGVATGPSYRLVPN
ncbi:MAG TPA: thiol-activated cytolysin family protein [Pyrinomonadaceae bacterium]|nr:thiol-activated cytolysin family protein [Pyrinomonadaceae bacterium]